MAKEVNIIEESHRVTEYIDKHGLSGESRVREVVYRRAYMYAYLRNVLHYTYMDIGRMFGKDHATVMHSIKKVHESFTSINDRAYQEITIRERDEFPMDTNVLFNRTSDQVAANFVISKNSFDYLKRLEIIHKLDDVNGAIEKVIQDYKDRRQTTIIES